MKYYKILIDNYIIAIATSNDFRFLTKNNLLINCSEEQGQFLFCNNNLYHAEWMNVPPTNSKYIFALILEINKEEYDTLYEVLNKQDSVIDEDSGNVNPYIEPESSVPSYYNLDEEQKLKLVLDRKLIELSHICNKTIESGVDVPMLDGTTHHFSLTTQDQLNLISLQAMIEQGMSSIPYHADGELCKFYTPAEIQMIISAATKWKTYHTTYYNALKNYVKSLNDIHQIMEIQYGIELPEEYQSEVLKALHD